MKKTLVTFALILVLSTSVIAGTLAMYTTKIDNLAEGSVTAKEFTLLENGTDTFAQNVKIAPGETKEWQFGVKNYNGTLVSETAMDLAFALDVVAADGKSIVAPLQVSVKNEAGTTVGSLTASGQIAFADEFALSASGQEKTYTVSVNWPSNNSVDANYAGADFGTALELTVTGTQK